jgi:hypothetical protein
MPSKRDDQMHINEDAVSFAAFSLTKILAAELLRKGILNREEFLSAIGREIDDQRRIGAPTNQDAATLLDIYCDEIYAALPSTSTR